jgi:hypothetical protein
MSANDLNARVYEANVEHRLEHVDGAVISQEKVVKADK